MSLLIRALIPFMRAPPSVLNYLPKAPSSDTITVKVMATYTFGGGEQVHNNIAEIREYNFTMLSRKSIGSLALGEASWILKPLFGEF